MKSSILAFALFVSAFATLLFAKDPGLPSRDRAIAALRDAGYTETPNQIPATVIDVGILRMVPYLSFRVGEDRELNIYGDPSAPACIEIGVYRSLLNSDAEKKRCLTFLKRILPAVDFGGVRLTGGRIMTGGMVVEVTPPDAPDAYGGWWISAYSLPLLHAATGTTASVSEVSVARDGSGGSTEWTPTELTQARPAATNSIGRVYVRSYERKDGTYVHSYTRSR